MKWKKIIGLIPARKGSKGLTDKNIKRLGELPLIDYTIQAAKESRLDDVYVSSNDERVIERAKHNQVKYLVRPDEFCSDYSSANDVIRHFIDWLIEVEGKQVQSYLLVYLQPTSPLRNSEHINNVLKLLEDNVEVSCLSVVQNEDTPFKYFRLDELGRLQSLFEEKMTNARRQDLPATFKPNGAIYAFLVSDFLKDSSIPSNGGIPFLMSKEESIDIDTQDDLQYALKVLSKL